MKTLTSIISATPDIMYPAKLMSEIGEMSLINVDGFRVEVSKNTMNLD